MPIEDRWPTGEISVKNKRNYYRILFVQPDAPIEVIRASYRTLMQKLRQHPDLGGEHWNASVINEAHNVLTDAKKRRVYDRVLFGEKDHSQLGKQHPKQRGGKRVAEQDDDGWRPFRPKVVI
jgi:DnaJ-class molecular chaperone